MDSGVRQVYGKVLLNHQTHALFPEAMFHVFTLLVGSPRTLHGHRPPPAARERRAGRGRLAPDVELHDGGDYTACYFGVRPRRTPPHDLRTLISPQLHQFALDMAADWYPRLCAIIEHRLPDAALPPPALRTSITIPAWPRHPGHPPRRRHRVREAAQDGSERYHQNPLPTA
ncbi:hypothetical protein OG259_07390 [Streptomyces sp. NBC_00250]|uniref:hypothetical protein n=1 Tax=Streptomyces sp. NBC_00250 TaxID=2903641 RepID=UPI002E2B021A|nr:hypothetical protein [Streptomyces sp. NBC_00250]